MLEEDAQVVVTKCNLYDDVRELPMKYKIHELFNGNPNHCNGSSTLCITHWQKVRQPEKFNFVNLFYGKETSWEPSSIIFFDLQS